jgi:hypothetical protein
MEQLGQELPAIADRCDLEAALAHEELGNGAEARRLFQRVPPTSRVYADARFGLSRVLRKAGESPPSPPRGPRSRWPAAPGPPGGRDGSGSAGDPGRPGPEPEGRGSRSAGRRWRCGADIRARSFGPRPSAGWAGLPFRPPRWWPAPRPCGAAPESPGAGPGPLRRQPAHPPRAARLPCLPSRRGGRCARSATHRGAGGSPRWCGSAPTPTFASGRCTSSAPASGGGAPCGVKTLDTLAQDYPGERAGRRRPFVAADPGPGRRSHGR